MRKRYLLVVLSILLAIAYSACSSTTPEPTAVPLSEVNLDSLLIQDGDLPWGLSGAQIRHSRPDMYGDLPTPESMVQRDFQRDGEAAGFVSVFLYDSQTDVDAAYGDIVYGFGEPVNREDLTMTIETVPSTGERAEAVIIEAEIGGTTFEAIDLAFVRCHAVVHIRMTGISRLLDIDSYAKRLDERLSTAVCR